MNPNLLPEAESDESASSLIERLTNEILFFQKDLASKKLEISDLQAREDVAKGIFFPQEIHALKQECLRLATEVELRQKRIRRIQIEN
ncbi:MAG: hypothetical protein EOM25_04670 [Deltaproteobacteria bacterium]|nr:hypothetical protein [Deltaproteobacteria bacterium]